MHEIPSNLHDLVYFEFTNSAGVTRIQTVRVGRLNDLSFGRYGKSGSKTTRMVEFMAFEREKRCSKLGMLFEP